MPADPMTPSHNPLRDTIAQFAEALPTVKDALQGLAARVATLEETTTQHAQILTDLLVLLQAYPDSWERVTARLRLMNATTWQAMEMEHGGEEAQ